MIQDNLCLPTSFGLVRNVRLSDTDKVVALVSKLAAYHGDVAALTRREFERNVFGDRPWIYVLVAEAKGELVGYAALCGLIQLQFGARGMDMHHLFVEEAFRGRGVGHGLVEACMSKARLLSCRYLAVGTDPENQAAQAFYEGLGFARRDAHPPRFSMRLEG